MNFLQTLLLTLLVSVGLAQVPAQTGSAPLVGVWQSAQNDLRVELTEENGHLVGRIVWFACPSHRPMATYRDEANPNPALRNRAWLGLKTLDNLTYAGQDTWRGGQIYDPNTGRTYDAKVTLTSPDRLTVRGYWKLPWLGKNLNFTRVPTSARAGLTRQ